MAKATDEAVQLQREEKIAKTNAIIQAAYAQTDSNGNMTEAAANEASLYLSQQVVDGLMSLEEAIDQMATRLRTAPCSGQHSIPKSSVYSKQRAKRYWKC